jgi:hypothetical protein
MTCGVTQFVTVCYFLYVVDYKLLAVLHNRREDAEILGSAVAEAMADRQNGQNFPNGSTAF